jgi:hypothetical protein
MEPSSIPKKKKRQSLNIKKSSAYMKGEGKHGIKGLFD